MSDDATGDKINTARLWGQSPSSRQTQLWPADLLRRANSASHGLKTAMKESQGLRLWWMTHSGHTYPHEWAYCGYLPCKFWHKRAVGATLLSRYQFIASVSSPLHNWFIANPFSVQCINHAAGCQGPPFMLLCRLQERGSEILLNSKEVVIMLTAFIHFSSVACLVTYMLKEVWWRSYWLYTAHCVHRISRESDLFMRSSPLCKLSTAFPKV